MDKGYSWHKDKLCAGCANLVRQCPTWAYFMLQGMLQLLHISSLGSPYILLWYCRLWECSIEALVAEIHDACTLMSLWSDWCPWGHHEGYWAFLWYQASSACCCCLSPCLSWVSCFDYGGFFWHWNTKMHWSNQPTNHCPKWEILLIISSPLRILWSISGLSSLLIW